MRYWPYMLIIVCSMIGLFATVYVKVPARVIDVQSAVITDIEVKPGSPVHVRYIYCKFTQFTAAATNIDLLVGGLTIRIEPTPLPKANVQAPVGCGDTTIVLFTLPVAVPAAAYGLPAQARITYTFAIGPKVITQTYMTSKFVIAAP